MSDPRPISTAPDNVKIMIYEPSIGKKWFVAIRTERQGCRTMRWKIFDYGGRGNHMFAGSQFTPEAWKPLETDDG